MNDYFEHKTFTRKKDENEVASFNNKKTYLIN